MRKLIRQLYGFRNICLMLLGLCLGIGMTSQSFAAEQSGVCGADLTWSLSQNTLTISGTGEMLDFSDGAFPGWYLNREEIHSIQFPSGMTSIGEFAFFGCENVTSVVIPSGITKIGDYAFAQCKGLKNVELGSEVVSIGEGAFQECESLMGISFPASVTEIGAKAFYRCYGIQTITIPANVKSMGSSAFAYCTGLVRATVNALMSKLPDWTFYGCDSLTDVSLASTIVDMGEFAFQRCDNLNGIYTQEGNIDTAFDLEKDIPNEDGAPPKGIVGTFEMPETSVVVKDDGKKLTETQVTQIEDTTISVTHKTEYLESGDKETIVIAALAGKTEDFQRVAQVAEQTLGKAAGKPVIVEIQLFDHVVDAEELAVFAGKNVIVKIITGSGVIWKIDMSNMAEKDFSRSYDLSVSISEVEAEKTTILSDTIYQLKFYDRINFNVTLGLNKGKVYDLATLYQKDAGEYKAVDTIVVDNDNITWFPLANIDKKTEYYIGMNVEGMDIEKAVVPETMLEQYDIDEEATLMDEEGTRYRITGRTSKWGISGKQFAMYVAVAMLATVLVVGIVMTTMNIIKRSKEKYERMAEKDTINDKIDEEAIRVEVLKELLGKKNK